MRSQILLVVIALLVISGPTLSAECECPQGAQSAHRLMTTGGSGSGLVVCGYEDGRRGQTVRGSEFEAFRCRDGQRLLQFGALDTADLEPTGENLRVTRVANWPFGVAWEWKCVPVAELLLLAEGEQGEFVWAKRLPKAEVAPDAIRTFLKAYNAARRRLGREYVPDEDVVAKLFAAMAAGDRSAVLLFLSMRKDVNLDGAAAEIYEMAVEDWKLGAEPPNSRVQRTWPAAFMCSEWDTNSRAAPRR